MVIKTWKTELRKFYMPRFPRFQWWKLERIEKWASLYRLLFRYLFLCDKLIFRTWKRSKLSKQRVAWAKISIRFVSHHSRRWKWSIDNFIYSPCLHWKKKLFEANKYCLDWEKQVIGLSQTNNCLLQITFSFSAWFRFGRGQLVMISDLSSLSICLIILFGGNRYWKFV